MKNTLKRYEEEFNMRALIVYYSWSGNARKIAKIIHELVGGDIVEIEPANPTPESYNETVEQAKRDEGRLQTAIKNNCTTCCNLPLTARFSGKKIAPFINHGGGGKQRTVEDIKRTCTNSEILPEFIVYGGGSEDLKEKVRKWLIEIGVVV
ncbi:MAG: Putative flavodoxin [Methanosarcinales archeaon 56_1174]|nr:MAG: Putative flavodoxin [Methanosarcinales archeaon 56_1174]